MPQGPHPLQGRTVEVVADVSMLPQRGRIVLVVLQDGRQLEGELHVRSGRYELDGVVFDASEIEELEGNDILDSPDAGRPFDRPRLRRDPTTCA